MPFKKLNKWVKNSQYYRDLPSHCLLCDAPGYKGKDICYACLQSLPKSPQRCPSCALPLPHGHEGSVHCGHCLQQQPHFDHSFALFDYENPIDYIIQRFKYHQGLAFGRLLGQLMLQEILVHLGSIPKPQLILPVPLHKNRIRQRGFNQALEIARPLSKALSLPVDTRSCVRIRDTGQQSSMLANKRKTNMKQAFGLVNKLDAAHVVIVDDVMTTGHTANELANLLKTAGVSTVSVWVVARASL